MCVRKPINTDISLMNSLNLDEPEDNCDYHDLNNVIDNQRSDLTALHINIRGLNSKLGELAHLIDRSFKCQPPDILMLCETWLKSNSPRPNIPGYQLERHDRKYKRGGGTGILISTSCRYKRRHDLEEMDCPSLESCFIEQYNQKKNILFGSIYRPPNTSPDEFIDVFTRLLSKIGNKDPKLEIVIGLDHNMDLLKHKTHRPTRAFVEKLYEIGLTPIITKPTRIAHDSATLIDNILVSQKLSNNTDQGIICDNTSDHLPCYTLLHDIRPSKKEDQYITTRDLREQNLIALKRKLSEGVLLPNPDHDVNQQFNQLHDTLMNLINNFIPLVNQETKSKGVQT